MDRRIFGLETEYGVTCAADDGRGLSADEVARYLFRKVVAWGRSSNVFLRNGSRLYLDVGSHPEYATAECDDVRQLVSMLVQTDRFGTSISQALRTQAEVSRTMRRQRAEERAAKLGVKLVFPLVFCLFPAMYVVTLGPAVIKFVRFFAGR